jgi:hypothetical protein
MSSEARVQQANRTGRGMRLPQRGGTGPPISDLGAELVLAWRVALDPHWALATSREIAGWVLSSAPADHETLDEAYAAIALACEALWDLTNPEEAVNVANAWLTRVERERRHDLDGERRLLRDVEAHRLLARACHRAKSPGAWHCVCAAYFALCGRVGDHKKLSARLLSDPFGKVATSYIRLLGIGVPAARCKDAEGKVLLQRFINDIVAFGGALSACDDDDDLTPFHAAFAMAFHAVCSANRPSRDRAVVEELLLWDDRTRPRDQRGEVTRLVIWATYCSYIGDDNEAARFRALSKEALASAEMLRHVDELKIHWAA